MDDFLLEPGVTFLNHGSFGALPASVYAEQDRWRRAVEAQPVRFLVRDLPGLIDAARDAAADFLGAPSEGLVFVSNATAAATAVMGSADLRPGDEILTTNHRYNAVYQAMRRAAQERGVRLVEAHVPFPLRSPEQITEAVVSAIGPRTRLLVLDQITSPTALIFPVAEIIAQARGVPVFVDGAHVPGQIPVDLGSLGATWWTGNLHKWAFAPRGTAAFYVAPEVRERTHAAVVSHGYGLGLRAEFDWPGTFDPSPWLCVPAALAAHARLGGARLMADNHARTREARRILADALGVALPCPDDLGLYAAMATLPLPLRDDRGELDRATALQLALWDQHRIEVPILPWDGRTWVRISMQAYNTVDQVARLGEALAALLR